jgi:hypothetical protein
VVFAGYQKYDGKSFRNLSSGEYIQMSGRYVTLRYAMLFYAMLCYAMQMSGRYVRRSIIYTSIHLFIFQQIIKTCCNIP